MLGGLTDLSFAGRHAMVAPIAHVAEGELAGWADGQLGLRLQHHSCTAHRARAVHNIWHVVEGGLQEEAVIAGKFSLSDQLFNLQKRHRSINTAYR